MARTEALRLRLERRYTEEMDRLRVDGWGGSVIGPARDRFDDVSWHMLATDGQTPVGMVRLTRGSASVLQHWSDGRAPLPTTADVIELTRGVVAAEFRGRGLYRLVMLEAMLRASRLEVATITAAVEPDFFARRFLGELGFVDVGAQVVLHDAPRATTIVQCIRADVSPRRIDRWRSMWSRQVVAFSCHGWRVSSDLWSSGREGPDVALASAGRSPSSG